MSSTGYLSIPHLSVEFLFVHTVVVCKSINCVCQKKCEFDLMVLVPAVLPCMPIYTRMFLMDKHGLTSDPSDYQSIVNSALTDSKKTL